MSRSDLPKCFHTSTVALMEQTLWLYCNLLWDPPANLALKWVEKTVHMQNFASTPRLERSWRGASVKMLLWRYMLGACIAMDKALERRRLDVSDYLHVVWGAYSKLNALVNTKQCATCRWIDETLIHIFGRLLDKFSMFRLNPRGQMFCQHECSSAFGPICTQDQPGPQ